VATIVKRRIPRVFAGAQRYFFCFLHGELQGSEAATLRLIFRGSTGTPPIITRFKFNNNGFFIGNTFNFQLFKSKILAIKGENQESSKRHIISEE
jgi:hypothetical protein